MTAVRIEHPRDTAPTDEQLVALVHAGRSDAFGLLYGRHREAVVRFLRYRAPDPHLAEDLGSEAFLRAFRSLHTFTGGSFAGWVTSIARNLLIDHFRRARAQAEVLVAECRDTGDDGIADPEAALIEALDRARTQDQVAELFTRLTADQRTCLHLRFFRLCSVAETAAAMSRSEGAVRVLQHRAIMAMRAAVLTNKWGPENCVAALAGEPSAHLHSRPQCKAPSREIRLSEATTAPQPGSPHAHPVPEEVRLDYDA